MKAYKIEILVIDFEEMGGKEIIDVIENTHYPNYCISPKIMDIKESDIGEWHDDHPLNKRNSFKSEYQKIFK